MVKNKLIRKIGAIGLGCMFGIMSITPAFAVQEQITKEYEFTTTSSNFSYDAPKSITEDGEIYELSGITYQQLSKSEPKTTTKSYDKLSSKSVPNTITVDGQTYTLSGTPTYKEHKTEAKTENVTETKTYNDLTPDEAKSKIKSSYTSNGLTYKQTNSSYKSVKNPFSDTTVVSAASENGTVSGMGIRIGLDSPKQGEWYDNMKSYMGYPSYYDVEDAKWVSDVWESGSHYERQLRISGSYETRNYTVTYTAKKQVSSGSTYYSATATYKQSGQASYKVKAIATYKLKANSNNNNNNNNNQNNGNDQNNPNGNENNGNNDNNQNVIDNGGNENNDNGIIDTIDPDKFKNKYLPWLIALAALAGAGVGTAIYFANKNNKQKTKEKLAKEEAQKKQKEEEKRLFEEEKAKREAEKRERQARKEQERLESKLKKEELKKNPKLRQEYLKQELDDKIKKALNDLDSTK